MKKYLLLVQDEDDKSWEDFKKNYKLKRLGKDLGESIITLIKRFNKEK